jgi:hypothetical protein
MRPTATHADFVRSHARFESRTRTYARVAFLSWCGDPLAISWFLTMPCQLSFDGRSVIACVVVRFCSTQTRSSLTTDMMYGGRNVNNRSLVVSEQGHTQCVPKSFSSHCGADRSRTGDLRLAKPALSQLSYGPVGAPLAPGKAPVEHWWARAELNCRPHAYQACALTT